MPLKYMSGEEVRKGDRILSGCHFGVIKFVADPGVDDPDTRWYVEEFGGGVMLSMDEFGLVFCAHPEEDDELDFISRDDVQIGDASDVMGGSR